MRQHVAPHHLHLGHLADEAVDLSGAAGEADALHHLISVGHIVGHEVRQGLIPSLDHVGPVANGIGVALTSS